ncbi:MAG: hypothetical protein G01um101438_886 [Parcubacteria group bacterium Gr01-1014_38]|nr:MAG: hypothetical protein G01um101438_886 [Parcubacteria group bacterium Gr01-1014_38]
MPQLHVYARQRVMNIPVEHLNGEFEEAALAITAELARSELANVVTPGLSLETIPFGDGQCVIAHRNLTFVRPSRHESPTSDAQYWIIHPFPEEHRLLLLQYLPRHGRTSARWHPTVEKRLYCLLGSCTLVTECKSLDVEGRDILRIRRRLVSQHSRAEGEGSVAAGIAHQLYAGDREPALNVIEIHGTTARDLKELDYRYVSWPD